ncbi:MULTISPECIES: ATP-dependent Clp protease proteolytic subunit [Inquilinus]|jgi:ATP-dependent Clp protease protease subunit|uniref:ATP-dependent Clp protease proteolytic subunit n=1 Tax=Inquilinus ginsengisoli TaxID=363840 RepID=A0ABU1JSM0_9PROT|nr:ATP-dependent Clp protease proteolytic subunit [Inquilinus ginsengisoli]MDR6291278.1 ATP-dependent Clp protease protease subunit [Inquilinus ginsengisoli]
MVDRPFPPRLDDEEEEEEEERPEKEKKEELGPQIGNILFKNRTVLLFGEISMKLAHAITAQLLALAADDDKKPIRLVINSPGGHVEAGDTIHDMIRFVEAPVQVIGTGWVASAGAHIYLAAAKENRLSLPNTRFLLHQPSGGAGGRAVDIDIEAREIIKMRRRLNEIIAKETGQPIEKVERDTDRNYWMSAEEAKTYGVVGKIINTIKDAG